MAFIGCINLSNIDLIGFIFSPSWSGGYQVFENVSGTGYITVTGGWNPNSALTYLKGLGLPGNWTTSP
jgi:hypothetical protein